MVRFGVTLAAVAILLLHLNVSYSKADCPYPDCTCQGHYIYCNALGFDHIPPLNYSSINTYAILRLENNHLIHILDNSLPSGLTEIDFGNNPISSISPGVFNNTARTLETLIFTNTQLTEIPDAFLSLTKLASLTIKNSPLKDWKPDVLKHIGSSLRELNLNNVRLTSWPSWIQYFPSLTRLYLLNSFLTPIPDSAFGFLVDRLQILTLASDGLTSVPKALTALKNLTALDLTNNYITEVENLPYLSKLETLSLGRNNISDVYKLVYELSPHSTTMTYLYLHENLLTTIPRLAHMSSLMIVNLYGNRINDSSSGSLPFSVFSLQLNDNQLPSIPGLVRSLPGLLNLFIHNNLIQEIRPNDLPASVSYLDIHGNAIRVIKDVSFPSNSSLRRLYLGGNPITNITTSAFITLSLLESIELKNTSLNRVPLALSYLTNLTSLDLRYNSRLVCTCQESGLVPWFKSRPSLSVDGTCGDISVSKFFTDLAAQCPKQ